MGRAKTHFVDRAKLNARNQMRGMQAVDLEIRESKLFHMVRRRSCNNSNEHDSIPIPDPTVYTRPIGEFAIDLTDERTAQGVPALAGVTVDLITPYTQLEVD